MAVLTLSLAGEAATTRTAGRSFRGPSSLGWTAPPPACAPGPQGDVRRNESTLFVSEPAREALLEGDQAARDLLDAPLGDDIEAEWAKVAALWRTALEVTAPGDCVPRKVSEGQALLGGAAERVWPPDPDGTGPRSSEGVDVAVQRRLLQLPTAARRACLGELARPARMALGAWFQNPRRKNSAIETLEWRHPGTAEALRACWILAESALEAGAPRDASTWLARGARHLRILHPTLPGDRGAELQGAQDRREALVARWGRPSVSTPPSSIPGSWDIARSIGSGDVTPLLGEPAPSIRGSDPFGPGPHAGLAPFSDGRALVQTATQVHLVDPIARHPAVSGDIASFLPHRPRPLSVQRGTPDALQGPGAAPWPLLPATFERASAETPGVVGLGVVLIHGRSQGSQSNSLLCLDVPRLGLESAGVARLRWGLRDGRLHRPGGTPTPIPALAELEDLEFQPGPRVVGSRVLVGARRRVPRGDAEGEYDREQEAWLLAFDLASGALDWSRPLARGIELTREGGRFRGVRLQESAGDPLGTIPLALAPPTGSGGPTPLPVQVFAGTNLGVGALVDTTDGRALWSLRTPRRKFEDPAWAPSRPRASGSAIAWTPWDGERLHWLRPGPDLGSEGLRVLPGREKGGAEALLSARGDEAQFLARSGRFPTLSAWVATNGSRRDALHLDPNEDFSGFGLVGERRAWISTQRGLYLLDLEREGLLLASRPWARGEEPGTCYGFGDRVLVLGSREVRVFTAVP